MKCSNYMKDVLLYIYMAHSIFLFPEEINFIEAYNSDSRRDYLIKKIC